MYSSISVSFFLCLGVLLISCERLQETPIIIEGINEPNENIVSFSASLEGDLTKALLVENGIKVYWESDDSIKVFQGNTSGKFVSTLDSPGAVSEFIGSTLFEGEKGDYWAIFPYSSESSLNNNGIKVVVPSQQTAVAGSLDRNAFCMIARSNFHEFAFKNICGGIKFSVTAEGVNRVVFKGNNDENLTGTVCVSLDDNGIPVINSLTNASKTIEIRTAEGESFQKGVWYYCSVLPVTLTNGYTISFYKDQEHSTDAGYYRSNDPVSVKRSTWGRIGEADNTVDYGLCAYDGTFLYKTIDGDPRISARVDFTSGGYSTYFYAKDFLYKGYFFCDISEWKYKIKTVTLNDNRITELILPSLFYFTRTTWSKVICSDCTGLETVIISEGCQDVYENEFRGCSSLKSVSLPSTISEIQKSAFSGCSALTSVSIPESVRSIQEYAFAGCEGLTRVDIPNLSFWCDVEFGDVNTTLWRERSNPLYYAHNLYVDGQLIRNLTIPEEITNVKAYAFCGLQLDTLIIPSTVTSAGLGAFSCSAKKVVVGSSDVFKNKSQNAAVRIYENSWKSDVEDIVILESATDSIPDSYFRGSSVRQITLPKNISYIGHQAFAQCSNLESISIPSRASIGANTFQDCSNLKRLVIGSSDVFEKWPFDDSKSSIEEIVLLDGATRKIPYGKFSGFPNLRSITLPSSVTEIADYAFSDCPNLKDVDLGDGVMSIGKHAFGNCPKLETLIIPSSVVSVAEADGLGSASFSGSTIQRLVIGSSELFDKIKGAVGAVKEIIILEGVTTTIPNNHFRNRASLISITIPDGVTDIGEYAFSGCTGLVSVNASKSVKHIGDYAFSGCTGLTNVPVFEGLQTMGTGVFSDCTGFNNITITGSETNIGCCAGAKAFFGCTNLSSVSILDGVSTIGAYAFQDCTNLSSVSILDGVSTIGTGAFGSCTALSSITIPESVHSIGQSAFSNCSNLTSITIPVGVKEIERSTFQNCSSLSTAVLKEGVVSIGWFAFSGCSSLTSITIPGSVKEIVSAAFRNCSSLSTVSIPEGITIIPSEAFSGCTGLQSITLPDGVEVIDNEAFAGCSGLASIYIPESVHSIGESAFKKCGFRSISLPDGLTTISDYCFYDSKINTVSIPESVTSIGSYAFSKSSLTSAIIPESVTSIGNYAFSNSSLTSAIIPESVTEIGEGAFSDCRVLSTVSLSEDISCIPKSAFKGCTGLSSIILPENVSTIGDSAFEGCRSLSSITIPGGVTSIGEYAFHDAYSLSGVIVLAKTPPALGSQAFTLSNPGRRRTIYVPSESVDLYKNDSNWKQYDGSITGIE